MTSAKPESLTALEDFWRLQFPRRFELLRLPLDRRRPPVPSYRREFVALTLERSVSDGLEQLCSRLDAPPPAVLLAALKTVLFRYTEQETMVVGLAVKESDSLGSGTASTLLPIHFHWAGQASLSGAALAQILAQQIGAARAHAQYPLRELQSWAGFDDAAYGARLFSVALCVTSDLDAGDDSWPMLDPAIGEFLVQCDVVVSADVTASSVTLKADFDADLFEPPTVRRMLGHFGTILHGVIRSPATTILRLPILTDSEQQRLVNQSAGKKNAAPAAVLHGLFEAQVERTPDAVALVCDGKSLTYTELNRQSNRVAHALRARGVGPGTIVGICMERSLELVTGLLGILKAGGAYLPIDLAYPKERLAFMLDDARAPILVTQSKIAADLPAHQAEVFCLDGAELDVVPTSNPDSGATADDLAYIIFTSGSTGKPKGALVTHHNVARLFQATQHWYGFDERDVWTLFHSCAFDFSVWELWGALLHGGRVVIVPYWVSRSPEDFRDLIVRERVTVLNQTPSAFRQLIQAELARPAADLALRYVIFGGEALELQSLQPWFDRYGDEKPLLVNMYGITETTVHVTYRPIRLADLRSRQGSVIGVPIPDLQVYVLDPYGQPVPPGVAGEMYIGGAGVARGYLNRPELTEQRFVPDPFRPGSQARLYRSGDRARWLANGDLEYLDRIDQQVKIRGFRIELGEIEAAIARHPSIRESAVIACEEVPGEKRLVAYVVANPAPADLIDQLRALLSATLPEYMVPAQYAVLPALPLTENGKVDRQALAARTIPREGIARRFAAPRTPTEAELVRIWSAVLRIDKVGIHDHFFELGGDSILSIQVVSRCRQSGLRLTSKDLFDHPTIAQLAEACTPIAVATDAAPEQVAGAVQLTPIECWFLEQDIVQRSHWNQAFLFELADDAKIDILEQALQRVVSRHDSLRLRMDLEGIHWIQKYAQDDVAPAITSVDLAGTPVEERPLAIECHAARHQASLNLAHGPLLRAVHFSFGPGDRGRLLLVIHHIAVDGVSWRVILEDLEAVYFSLIAGQEPVLPAKTTSYQVWAERLAKFAQSTGIISSLPYWLAEASKPVTVLSKEREECKNLEAEARSINSHLTSEETQALLQRVPQAYRTQINDVLLSALGRALQQWTGGAAFRFDLEGHGREDLFGDVDVSRTVGWFTTLFPVRLELGTSQSEGEALKSVKEQLRGIANRGMSYGLLRYSSDDAETRAALSQMPRSDLLFNYLGQFDQVVSDSKLFSFAAESTGPWHCPASRRTHALEVLCLVRAGQLEIHWMYHPQLHDRDAIERVAQLFVAALRATIAHCLAPDAGGRTPSDFPLAVLGQHDVDQLWERYPGFEDAYPLSPMQRLFYAMEGTRGDPGFEQWHFRLEGWVDAALLRRSIEHVAARHSILRTVFVSDIGPEPLQIVLRDASLTWSEEDWRALGGAEQAARLADFMELDRQARFDLTQAPLMRLALRRIDTEAYHLIWSTHHLCIDGWSWPLVFRGVSQVYQALRQGAEPRLDPPLAYGSYIAWLRSDAPASEGFWKEELAGIAGSTPLNLAAPPAGASGFADHAADLDEDATEALRALARSQHVTLSTIVQGAWSLLLSHYSGSLDVVFGAAFSGRPAEVPRIDSLVGPCVNNLPVRVAVTPSELLLDWLSGLQRRQVALAQHQYLPLEQIQKCTAVPWRHRLFDSLIVFQNYEIDDSARRLGGDVRLVPVAAPETTNYPLTLTVTPGKELRLRLIYACDRFTADVVKIYAADLVTILRAIGRPAKLLVTDLQGLLPASTRAKAGALAATKVPEARAPYSAPTTEAERAVAALWQDLFAVERVSLDDNFFDLGGHSLLLLQAHSRLRATVRSDLPVVALLQYPTVRTLGRYLSGQATPALALSDVKDRARKRREALSRQRNIVEKR